MEDVFPEGKVFSVFYILKIRIMQPKFTLKRKGVFFGLTPILFTLFFLLSGKINAQQYINGNLSTGATHAGTGTVAPSGYTWSELQGSNSGLGYGANITAGFSLADNFVVPAGPSWNVTKITFFAYSTGFSGTTSPFVDTRVQIYNTDPSTGNPAPIFGDLTTNRFLSSTSAFVYRTSGTTAGTTRLVWKIETTINTTLAPGTYWVEWAHGNGGLSNFTPPSTVVGQPSPAGANSKQRDFSGGLPGTWVNLVDAGGGGAQDQYFIIDYTTGACSGTPTPGNTLSTVSTVCPGTNFTLSLQNSTSGSGVTYQWQSGTSATGPWSNITGATNSTLTTQLSATTFYQCIVSCSGNPATSTPVQVLLTPPSSCYCIPTGSDCTDDDVITRVRISTLDNSSTCGAGPPAGYSNYTSSVAAPTVYSGANNPIIVNVPTVWTEQVAVWIDYNQNGQFETTEFTNLGNNVGNGGVLSNNIAIPSTALNGTTRMRVRVRFSTAWTNAQACTGVVYGETEDYHVTIAPCVPITITSSPANTSTTCGGNASFTVATSGTLPAYSWEYRTSSTSAWQTVNNGGIYSGATTATLTLTSATAAYNGYQYRAVVVGGCSATDVSGIGTLTVNPIVATVNPSSATICAGSIQQLSLTNITSAPVTATYSSGTVSATIPESNDGTSFGTNTIAISNIPSGAIITGIKVKLNMTHNWVGDVCYVLKAPNGAVFNLDYFLSATGNGGVNFLNTEISHTGTAALSSGTSPFTGTFKADAQAATVPSGFPPSGPAGYTPTTTAWSGLYSTPNGNWTLAFYDYFIDPDPGTLTKWDLEITYVAPVFAQGTWGGPTGTIFTDAAATVPYTGTPVTTVYVKPTVTSNYTVSFTTSTPCTSATTTIPVTVNTPVTGLAVAPATRSVCLGGSTTFSASTTGGSPVTYQWQRSTDNGLTWSNITGATSTTLTVSDVTSAMTGYRYRVVATAGTCGSVTSTSFGTLTVNPLPTVAISSSVVNLVPGRTTTITGTSTPAAATNGWVWTLNGTVLTGASNTQTANIDGLGTYQATVTDVNGCVNTSNTLVIGAEASDKLWIYPNPTTGAFQVRLYYGSDAAEKRIVSVYSPNGQLITSREFDLNYRSAPYQSMAFDLSGMARGTYVVKVAHKYSGKVISGLLLVQ